MPLRIPHAGTAGSRIVRTRPLAWELQAFWSLAGAGGGVPDLAGTLPLALAGGAAWSAAAGGAGLVANAAGAGAFAVVPAAVQTSLATPISVAVAFRFLANPSSNASPIFGIYGDNSTSARLAAFETNNPPSIQMGYAGGSFTTSFAAAVGVDYVASGSVVSGSQLAYVNGRPQGSASLVTNPGWGASSRLIAGPVHAFFAARVPNVLIYWGGWWARTLLPVEHAAIGAHPGAIFGLLGPIAPAMVRPPPPATAAGVRRTLSDRPGSRGVA